MSCIKLIKSTSIILENTRGEILLCLRNKSLKSFPDLWVFPGGKIDTVLSDDWIGDELDVVDTAIREMYEEIGFLPGVNTIIDPSKRNRNWLIYDYNDEERKYFIDKLEFIGRKRTPYFMNKSFDTAYFYIMDKQIDNIHPVPDGSEIIECRWIKPSIAIEHWKNNELKFAPPTLHLLNTLAFDHDNIVIKTMVETDLPIGLQTKVQFAPGITAIPFFSQTIEPFISTNMIIINSNHETLLVDPGSTDKKHLNIILQSINHPKYVVITHHHIDHWDGLDLIEKIFPNTILLIHENGLDRINTTLSKEAIGDYITIGVKKIEVIKTPGHTDDHISLYDLSTKVLIAGDHIVGYGSAVLDHNYGSMIEYFNTNNKLISYDINLILPAHGPPIYNASEKIQEYIDHRQNREKSILAAIVNGASTLDEIVSVVYADVPENMWLYAKRNIQLHIKKLIFEKKITSFNF